MSSLARVEHLGLWPARTAVAMVISGSVFQLKGPTVTSLVLLTGGGEQTPYWLQSLTSPVIGNRRPASCLQIPPPPPEVPG